MLRLQTFAHLGPLAFSSVQAGRFGCCEVFFLDGPVIIVLQSLLSSFGISEIEQLIPRVATFGSVQTNLTQKLDPELLFTL